MNKIVKFITATIFCLLVGFAGSFVTMPAIATWYKTLNKPFFNPPNWIFAPVWTLLFIMMGISAGLIWNQGLKKKKIKTALAFFSFQLVLNFLWSFLFFGSHSPFLALIDIVFLWGFILLTIKKFSKISLLAGWLMVPYFLWVSFASVLNFFVWRLN